MPGRARALTRVMPARRIPRARLPRCLLLAHLAAAPPLRGRAWAVQSSNIAACLTCWLRRCVRESSTPLAALQLSLPHSPKRCCHAAFGCQKSRLCARCLNAGPERGLPRALQGLVDEPGQGVCWRGWGACCILALLWRAVNAAAPQRSCLHHTPLSPATGCTRCWHLLVHF